MSTSTPTPPRNPLELTTRGLLGVALQADPGDRFIYSDVSAHLVSAILAGATGQSRLAYGTQVLFDPLGIDTEPANQDQLVDGRPSAAFDTSGFGWATDDDGINLGCCFLRLTADDMATLGQLYLDGGRWNGQQVVPTDWVTASTRPTELNSHYGYLWRPTPSPTSPGSPPRVPADS